MGLFFFLWVHKEIPEPNGAEWQHLLSLRWLCASRRSFLFFKIMVSGARFCLGSHSARNKNDHLVCLSVCLSVGFDAASGLVLLLQKEEQWLNRSAPSFAKWCSVCCQVNQLRGSALCLPACLFCRLIFKRSGWQALHLPAWRFSWEWEGGNTAVYVTPNSVFPCFPEYAGKQHCGCTHTGPWVYICMSSVENDFSW